MQKLYHEREGLSMPLPLYLALTAPEISAANPLPEHLAYMACHFSSSNMGLSNFPLTLPEGSMLILNDSTPAGGHDPELISRQVSQIVEQFGCRSVLLDFQRKKDDQICRIIQAIIRDISCPVAVSEIYATQLNCPVFLSAVPADRPLKEWLRPWEGRDIWLEAALDASVITLDKSGSSMSPCAPCDPDVLPYCANTLHCHYKIEIAPEQVQFTLQRTQEDLNKLLLEAQTLGVAVAVGLYQELGSFSLS